VPDDVEPAHRGRAPIGPQQRGQDAHGGRLAAPFGPSTPRTVPGRAARSTPASAVVVPKRLTRPSARIAQPMAFLPSWVTHAPCPGVLADGAQIAVSLQLHGQIPS
jgi:hypothetical protein